MIPTFAWPARRMRRRTRTATEPDLTSYEGQWVAIKAGQVVAHHRQVGGLMREMELLGRRGAGALGYYVAPRAEGRDA